MKNKHAISSDVAIVGIYIISIIGLVCVGKKLK